MSNKALRTRWALRALVAPAPRREVAPVGPPARGVSVMGLRLPSALGLAAGFDRSGALAGRAAWLGLGAVEIGSLGAGSRELDHAIRALRRARAGVPAPGPHVAHGVSLVKRAATLWPAAADELAGVLRRLHGLADYVTLNPGRDRPSPAEFAALVARLGDVRDRLACGGGRPLPLVAKLPSGWLRGDAGGLAQAFAARGADGLLLSAEGVSATEHLETLRRAQRAAGGRLCLISVGGVRSAGDALQRLRAGAALVQVHAAARRTNRRPWMCNAVAALARR